MLASRLFQRPVHQDARDVGAHKDAHGVAPVLVERAKQQAE
jgi:hypothetical protein